jgi:hypothetical protein
VCCSSIDILLLPNLPISLTVAAIAAVLGVLQLTNSMALRW